MADPKEFSETPNAALPGDTQGAAETVQPSSGRDPILEELLKSKSVDDEEGTVPSKKSPRSKKQKPAKTGTSLDRKSKKSKLPLITALVAAVLIIGGGGTALWLTLTPGAAQIDPDRNKGKTQAVGEREINPEDEADAAFNTEAGVFPIPLEEWQKAVGTEGVSPENEAALLQTMLGSDLYSAAGVLPAEAAGFTSDDSLVFNEDGSLNTLYSFWTRESFTSEAGQIIEKFLNPRFGAWEAYQGKGADPNGIDPVSLFPNTFTDDALKTGDPVSKWLPIYADWSNNNYGRSDLSATGQRWYGQVQDSTSEFVWDEASSQYDVTFTANVKFTAYKSTGEKVSEKGVLTLEFVANPGGERGPGGKVLVNRSSLTIGG